MEKSVKSLPTRKRTRRSKVTGSSAKGDAGIPKLIHQPLPIKMETRKRKFTRTDGSASDTSNLVSASSSKRKRKVQRPEYLSDHHMFSDDESDQEEVGFCNSTSGLENDEGKYFSSSKWSYVDLQPLNVDYEKESISIEELCKEIKEKFTKIYQRHPDPTKVIESATEFLRKNVTFSFDLRDLVQSTGTTKEVKMSNLEAAFADDINMIANTDLSTLSKFHIIAGNLLPYLEFTREIRDLAVRCSKANIVKKICSEKRFQDICEKFMEMYFLKKTHCGLKPYQYKNKTVRSFPDLTYPFKFHRRTSRKHKLFFVIEVKSKPMLNDRCDEGDESMESKVGFDIMGQVESELLLEADHSFFFPDSLAIACMETKLIFLFLRGSKVHYNSMQDKKGPIKGKAMIAHTQPFDMLNAEHRMKMAELLFWLGCMQDELRYRYISPA